MSMNTRNTNTSGKATITGVLALAGLTAAGISGMAGCQGDRSDKPPRQFFPDLDNQPKWKPQSQSGFFPDGRTMRQPVKGTVAYGYIEFSPEATLANPEWAAPWNKKRDILLKENDAIYQGTDAKGAYLDNIPIAVDAKLLMRGQERFNIYCSACHGYDGAGKGTVGQQWSYALPNFHDQKYIDRTQPTAKDGYIFHTARMGLYGPDGAQKMPGYAHALNEYDAWAVVAYIRVLQESRSGTLNDVPENERAQLKQQMQAAAGAAAAATPPATAPAAAPAPGTGGAK
jgi:mono/diheme cytochrome c family protein